MDIVQIVFLQAFSGLIVSAFRGFPVSDARFFLRFFALFAFFGRGFSWIRLQVGLVAAFAVPHSDLCLRADAGTEGIRTTLSDCAEDAEDSCLSSEQAGAECHGRNGRSVVRGCL